MAIDSAIPARAAEQKSRLLAALGHEHPDRVPLDLGSTAVTGIHVSCVAELRDYYGLQRRPVKIHEPYQMLGLVEDDLRAAMGVDTVGAFPAKTMFGFRTKAGRSGVSAASTSSYRSSSSCEPSPAATS